MSSQLGGATTLYICPTCGCPDLMVTKSALALAPKDRKAICPNCKWEGTLAEAGGIATTEKVFDTKTILNLLLYVTTKHAAGPISQAFIFFGLVEKGDQVGLDKIMRAATEGLIEKAFMAAAEHAATKGTLGEAPPAAKVKETCPWCGGRHILGEEHDFSTGEPNRCRKCDGRGELTAEEIAKFEAEDKVRFGERKLGEETLVGRGAIGSPRLLNKGPGQIVGSIELTRSESEPVVEGDEQKNLGKIVEAIESHPLQVQTMLMDQETAKAFGIDVDALNAGAPSVPFPPKMTEENMHLFNSRGEYDPAGEKP